MNSIKITTLQEFFKNKEKYFVKEEIGYTAIEEHDEGSCGDYNETFKFYKHPEFPENIFFRETWWTDSYGNNSAIKSFEFVEGKKKTITIYEPII